MKPDIWPERPSDSLPCCCSRWGAMRVWGVALPGVDMLVGGFCPLTLEKILGFVAPLFFGTKSLFRTQGQRTLCISTTLSSWTSTLSSYEVSCSGLGAISWTFAKVLRVRLPALSKSAYSVFACTRSSAFEHLRPLANISRNWSIFARNQTSLKGLFSLMGLILMCVITWNKNGVLADHCVCAACRCVLVLNTRLPIVSNLTRFVSRIWQPGSVWNHVPFSFLWTCLKYQAKY